MSSPAAASMRECSSTSKLYVARFAPTPDMAQPVRLGGAIGVAIEDKDERVQNPFLILLEIQNLLSGQSLLPDHRNLP
jgi:hypothetical protein